MCAEDQRLFPANVSLLRIGRVGRKRQLDQPGLHIFHMTCRVTMALSGCNLAVITLNLAYRFLITQLVSKTVSTQTEYYEDFLQDWCSDTFYSGDTTDTNTQSHSPTPGSTPEVENLCTFPLKMCEHASELDNWLMGVSIRPVWVLTSIEVHLCVCVGCGALK